MANNAQIPNMTPVIGLTGSELIEVVQDGESKRASIDQVWDGLPAGNGITQLTGDVTAGPGPGSVAATIASHAVTLAKMAQIATARFLGRVTAATGDVEVLTGTQATTLLDTFTSLLKGLAPASGGGVVKYLRSDATWVNLPYQETVPISDETTLLSIGVKATFRMPCAVTMSAITCSLTEAATGATLLQVNVTKNGVTVFSTQITIDASETTSVTAANPSVLSTTAFAYNDEIKIEIIAVGNTSAGKGAKVTFLGVQS